LERELTVVGDDGVMFLELVTATDVLANEAELGGGWGVHLGDLLRVDVEDAAVELCEMMRRWRGCGGSRCRDVRSCDSGLGLGQKP
jgi:hypothetical protein